MRERKQPEQGSPTPSVIFGKAWRLKVPLLVLGFALSCAFLLALALTIGAVRFVQSLNEGSIAGWRLLALFAHVTGCAFVLMALCARGRSGLRRRTIHRGRVS